MSSNIKGMQRTCYVAELDKLLVGNTYTLMGWCQKQRNLGGLIFITLRDRSGLLQLVTDDTCSPEVRETAAKVRSEDVLAVKGILRLRSNPNNEMPTGKLELLLQEIRIVAEAETTPFYIEDDVQVKDSLKLQYRYLDLRRPALQKIIMLRSKLTQLTNRFFEEEGFINLETPILGKSTPEGARDYLVPSRIFPGEFFALPQSPQLFKQLLMVAGFDKYIQIARCFRDEDLRADRQPEFTQIDMEMSFVDEDDVMQVAERFIQRVFKELKNVDIKLPLRRMDYKEAMEKYGSDKPDLRFGLELQDISDLAATLDFTVFKNALSAPQGAVKAIKLPHAADLTRKQLDKLAELVKTYRADGLLWLLGSGERSSFTKFITPEFLEAIRGRLEVADDDMIFIVAGNNRKIVNDSLGHLRCELAVQRGLIDPECVSVHWVVDFPLLDYDEQAGRYVAEHHPFTMLKDEDLPLLQTDPLKVRSKAYDMVINGYEAGGGSIRIHEQDIQKQVLQLLGFSPEQAQASFGFLLDAFKYGVPPHGGLAFGMDRLVMLLTGTENIRDVIAFPKVQTSACLMTQAPSEVSKGQLQELGICTAAAKETAANESK